MGARTRSRTGGGGVLLLEAAPLGALRSYISLWERGLGHHEAFLATAVAAALAAGVTDKALYLIGPFPELHDDLAVALRGSLLAPPTRTGRKLPSAATVASIATWLAQRSV